VIVLRFHCDLSEREIADALGCRPGTVKSLASRALTSLHEALS
jgi:DNA-directed RNA polymerase specialized sigma24 family protein